MGIRTISASLDSRGGNDTGARRRTCSPATTPNKLPQMSKLLYKSPRGRKCAVLQISKKAPDAPPLSISIEVEKY